MDTETAGNGALKATSETCADSLAGERFESMDHVLGRAIRAAMDSQDHEGKEGVERREDAQNDPCSHFPAMMIVHRRDSPSWENMCGGCRAASEDLHEREYPYLASSGVHLAFDIDVSFRLKHMPVHFQGWKGAQEVARRAAYDDEKSRRPEKYECLRLDGRSCPGPDSEGAGDDDGYESDVPPLIILSDE